MKYCRYHDLAFCSKHLDQCGETCSLVENPEASFCCVCDGLLKPVTPGSVYDDAYFLRGAETGKSLYTNYRWLPDLTIPMAKRIIEHLGFEGDKSTTILDYGCSRGYLVRALRGFGYKAYGVDVSAWAIENADEIAKPHLVLIKGIGVGLHADWIIAKDVLEHVQNLSDIVEEMLAFANRGIFAVVPLSMRDGCPYVIDDYERDITHIHRLTLATWAGMFMRPGWTVEASYAVRGVKENYAYAPMGNGFVTVRRQ